MSIPSALTEAEEDLLNFARRALGSNLYKFLLFGLDAPHHPRRRFTARSIRAHEPQLIYQLEAVSESEKGLPGGRDPVVMAALLHMLWTGERGQNKVVFRDEELIAVLSWPDTREVRLAVEAAVERYYNTAYHRTNRKPLGPSRGELVSSQVQKLITGYDTTLELRGGRPKEVRKSTTLHFTTKLVEDVTGTGKYFLGINFERLEALIIVDPLFRNGIG